MVGGRHLLYITIRSVRQPALLPRQLVSDLHIPRYSVTVCLLLFSVARWNRVGRLTVTFGSCPKSPRANGTVHPFQFKTGVSSTKWLCKTRPSFAWIATVSSCSLPVSRISMLRRVSPTRPPAAQPAARPARRPARAVAATVVSARCTRRSAPSAARTPRFRSNPAATNRSTALTATRASGRPAAAAATVGRSLQRRLRRWWRRSLQRWLRRRRRRRSLQRWLRRRQQRRSLQQRRSRPQRLVVSTRF